MVSQELLSCDLAREHQFLQNWEENWKAVKAAFQMQLKYVCEDMPGSTIQTKLASPSFVTAAVVNSIGELCSPDCPALTEAVSALVVEFCHQVTETKDTLSPICCVVLASEDLLIRELAIQSYLQADLQQSGASDATTSKGVKLLCVRWFSCTIYMRIFGTRTSHRWNLIPKEGRVPLSLKSTYDGPRSLKLLEVRASD